MKALYTEWNIFSASSQQTYWEVLEFGCLIDWLHLMI